MNDGRLPRLVRRPGAQRSTARGVALLCLVCLLVQASVTSLQVGPYDEALSLYGGMAMRHGAVPYRDFWSLYGPAPFAVLATAFSTFGESVLTGRCLDAVYCTLVVVAVFVIGCRLGSPRRAWIAALFVLLLLAWVASYLAPIFPAVAGALFAVAAADHAMRSGRDRGWFASGLAAGVAATFRDDIGAYACLAVVAGQIVPWATDRAAWFGRLRRCATFAGGVAIIVVPVAIALFAVVPPDDLLSDFVRIPFGVYAPNRTLPFPSVRSLLDAVHARGPAGWLQVLDFALYLPLAMTAWAAVVLWRRRVDATADPSAADRSLPTMLLVLNAFFCLKGSVRVSLLHMSAAFVTTTLLALWLAGPLQVNVRRWTAASVAVAIAAIVAIVALPRKTLEAAIDRVATSSRAAVVVGSLACRTEPIARLGCFRISAARRQVVDYVRTHTRDDEAIYVGSIHHDRLLINDVSLYFLADRRAPTRWYDLHPGVQTTAAVQAAMIGHFAARRPALIVLDQQWENVREPNASAVSSGVTLLDRWIEANYAPVLVNESYVVLAPRGPGTARDRLSSACLGVNRPCAPPPA